VKNNLNIDLKNQLTLPTTAFNIFKSNFYSHIDAPITKNGYDKNAFIRESYLGGVPEGFVPHLKTDSAATLIVFLPIKYD
jgi:hypothetical protein